MEWRTRRGQVVPRIGQGTWKMGLSPELRATEVAALTAGLERGLTLIDTAEAYGHGEAERIVGEAIRGQRDAVFLTTKVRPQNATRDGVVQSLEGSLQRLGTDAVDLYLLHWPSKEHPLEETLAGLQDCMKRGLTRYIGVSNFPTPLLDEARKLGFEHLYTDQVEYSLLERRAEISLIPYAREHNMTLMAYSPLRTLVESALPKPAEATLAEVAERHGVSAAVIALAWVLRPEAEPMVAIPKTIRVEHLDENLRALECRLTPEDLHVLDGAFPAPTDDIPLRRL